MSKNTEAFHMMEDDYKKYEETLQKNISRMVTMPDPKDGHTHVVYIDTDGNGMTTHYPEDSESYNSHKHMVIGNKVVPHTDGYSISFHTGLQSMAQWQDMKKKKKEQEKAKKDGECDESEAASLLEVFNNAILGGKVGHGIPDEREKETDNRIDHARRKLDEEIKSKINK